MLAKSPSNARAAQKDRSAEFQVVRRSRTSSAFAMRRFSAHRRTFSGLPMKGLASSARSSYTAAAVAGLSVYHDGSLGPGWRNWQTHGT